ncbi:MAG: tetratricopeptide repeat protein [Spirochaetes bacterium]|nr:tetratricopeptide repeat protein [Spirochaetota bacterium]
MMKHRLLPIVIILLFCTSCGMFRKSSKTEPADVITAKDVDIPDEATKKEKDWDKLTKDEKKKRNQAVKKANEGNKELEKGNFKKAIGLFEEALQEWELPDAHLGLGNAFYKNEDYNKALLSMDRYLSYNVKNYSPYYVKGLCYKKLDDNDNALRSFLSAARIKDDDPLILIEIANLYFDNKNYTLSYDHYERAQKIDEKLIEPYLGMGNIELALKEYEKALEILQAGLVIKKDKRLEKSLQTAQGFVILKEGNEFLKDGKYKEAIEKYKASLEYIPDSYEASYNLGNAYTRINSYTNAIDYFNKAIKMDPEQKDVYMALASANLKIKQYEKAIDILDEATVKFPGEYTLYNLKGLLYAETESYLKAVENFNRAVSIKQDFANGYLNLGKAYYNAQMYQKALESFKKAYDLDDDLDEAQAGSKKAHAMMMTDNGNRLFDEKKYKEAVEQYRKALDLESQFIETMVNLGNTYLILKNYNQAIEQFQKALSIEKDYYPALSGLQRGYRESGQVEQAKQIADKLEKVKGKDPMLYYKMGLSYEAKRKYKDAIDEYQKSLRVDPGFNKAKKRIGMVYYKQGILLFNEKNYDSAVEQFDLALKFNRTMFDAKDKIDYVKSIAYVNRAISSYKSGNNNAALANYIQALNLYPNLPEVYLNMGHIYIENRALKEAGDIIKKGLKLNPNFVDYYIILGTIANMQNNLKSSYNYFSKALQLSPDNSEIYNQIGEIFLKEGNYNEALNNFKESIKLNPGNEEAHINLGIAYYRKGDYQKAANEFEATKKLNKGYDAAYFNAGLVYYKMNQYIKSEKNFLFAIQLNKAVASFYFYLARTEYFIPGKINNAIKNVERALSIQESAVYHYGAGKIYEKKMEFATSLEKPKYLNQAIKAYRTVLKQARGTALANWAYERLLALLPDVNLINDYALYTESDADPDYLKGLIVAGDKNGVLYFINTQGDENYIINTVNLDAPISSDIRFYNNIAFAGCENGQFYAISQNGQTINDFNASDAIISKPVVNKNMAIFCSRDGNVYGWDFRNNRLQWKTDLGEIPGGGLIYDGGSLYVAGESGTVFSLSATSGRILWKRTCVGNIQSDMASGGNSLVVGTDRGKLYILNKRSGNINAELSLNSGVFSGVEIEKSIIYVGSGPVFYAMNLAGKILWQFYANSDIISKVTVSRKLILFGTEDGFIYALNANDGSQKWRYSYNSPITGKPIIKSENIALVPASNGSILELYYKK